jgi:outer membrane protein TolC
MELTQETLEALADKLAPAASGLSADERTLLNDVFNVALNADPEVVGLMLELSPARQQMSLRSSGSGNQAAGGGSSTSPGPSGSGSGRSPSASFDPVGITFKFF